MVFRVALDEPAECWAPTALGEANAYGFLWHRSKPTGKWTRRYAVCCASFVILFAEKDAPSEDNPPAIFSAKPVGAICFEDLEVTPIDPPPAEKEVAAFSDHAFSVGPVDERTARGGNFFSGVDGPWTKYGGY